MTIRIQTIAGLVGCALALSACSSRPSEDSLTKSILTAANGPESKVALSADQATCIAKALLASDLSDTTMAGLAQDFNNPQVLESESKAVEPAVEAAAQSCSGPTG